MKHALLIQFDPADNPSQLSKVGNWVITYITNQLAENTQLAITNVIPRQIQEALQVRRFIIENTATAQIWTIHSIECFDSNSNQTLELNLETAQARQTVEQLLTEFARYDVDARIIE